MLFITDANTLSFAIQMIEIADLLLLWRTHLLQIFKIIYFYFLLTSFFKLIGAMH